MTCTGCERILNAISISIGSAEESSMRLWHPGCFTCTNCRQPLSKELFFTSRGNWPFCFHCREFMFAPRCTTCIRPIRRYALLALNVHWHRNCFRCQTCLKVINEEYYLAYDNLWVCETCYKRPGESYDYGIPPELLQAMGQVEKTDSSAKTLSADNIVLNPEDVTPDDFQTYIDEELGLEDNATKNIDFDSQQQPLRQNGIDKDTDFGHMTISDLNADLLDNGNGPAMPAFEKSTDKNVEKQISTPSTNGSKISTNEIGSSATPTKKADKTS